MARILIGCRGIRGARRALAAKIDAVELEEAAARPLKRKTLRKWRDEMRAANPDLALALTAPYSVCQGSGAMTASATNTEALGRCLDICELLSARALVLRTDSEFTPAAAARPATAELLASARREGLALVWIPRGPWSYEESLEAAAACDFVLGVDPLNPAAPYETVDLPPGPLAYFDLPGPLTRRARYTRDELEQIARAADAYEETLVILGHTEALADAKRLRSLIGV
jgi:hypothetical protein